MRLPVVQVRPEPSPALRWTASFCALAIWLLGVLATSQQLHASVHSEADHLNHACAVTLFNHGVEAATGGACIAGAPVLFPAGRCFVQPALPVARADNRLPPGRGPPPC